MRMGQTARVASFIGALGATAALVGAATGTTGAYFSDSHDGNISGTIGSVRVATSGGSGSNGLDFNFSGLLPGDPQSATVKYANTGNGNEDIWLVFPDANALHAINDLGGFGEAHIDSNGAEIFASDNLNDHTDTCNDPTLCKPLPAQIKLADNVAPNGSGQMKFTFGYAAKLQDPNAEGKPFNCYPVGDATCPNDGLPYQIVATQHGIAPGVATP